MPRQRRSHPLRNTATVLEDVPLDIHGEAPVKLFYQPSLLSTYKRPIAYHGYAYTTPMKASKLLRTYCAFPIGGASFLLLQQDAHAHSHAGFTDASARHAQFYTQSEQYGVALDHRSNDNSGDLYMHLEAPSSYQWADVGIGDKMAGSFMLVMRVTGAGGGARKVACEARLTAAEVDLSTRTASGHATPEEISLHFEVLALQVSGGRMQAQVRWDLANADGLAKVDVQSTKQAWIWGGWASRT